jgi:D-serine deaminase-like pyridoxal phosphate-dependent protein
MKLTQPTLLLDEQKCRNNISRMTDMARRQGVVLQPHFKTHQSLAIGEWFREQDITSITVSSLKMAEYFAQDGWKEITVAFPANILRKAAIRSLAKHLKLNLYVNNLETARYLEEELKHPVGVFTEIDTGYHRTGIPAENTGEIAALLNFFQSSDKLRFKGIYAHNGNTYHVQGREAVNAIHRQSLAKLQEVKDNFSHDHDTFQIALGDTPSCSLADDFSGVDIIRPGNFVFYDLVQAQVGSCRYEDIAVCMACPVVEKHPGRGEIVVHGGAVHFSKDALEENGHNLYGKVVRLHDKGWGTPLPDGYIKSLSQEHGIVKVGEEQMKALKIGDWIGVLPVHSCLTADMMKQYHSISGQVMEAMP